MVGTVLRGRRSAKQRTKLAANGRAQPVGFLPAGAEHAPARLLEQPVAQLLGPDGGIEAVDGPAARERADAVAARVARPADTGSSARCTRRCA
jgi:hypothetical protein